LDGGFAIAGTTSDNDFWLGRTDNEGKLLWQHTYGGNNDDSVVDLVALPDGGFALTGETDSKGPGSRDFIAKSDFWLVRTNPQP
jgi:hypothetical protein